MGITNQGTIRDAEAVKSHVQRFATWTLLIAGRAIAVTNVELAKTEDLRQKALQKCVEMGVPDGGVDFIGKLYEFFQERATDLEQEAKQLAFSLQVC